MQTKYSGIHTNLHIEMPEQRKCKNPECNRYIPDGLRESGYEARYCSIKCRSRAQYLRTKK
jgi:hypothetical protein